MGVFKLSNLDIYSIKTEFSYCKSEKFSTGLGLTFSFLSFLLIGFFSFMFGRDLFFKKNPKLISQMLKPEDYNMVEVSNQKFPVIIRFFDGSVNDLPPSKWGFHPRIWYYEFVKEDGNDKLVYEIDFLLTKCKDTSHKDHPLLEGFDLDWAYCVDFDFLLKKIGRKKLLMGGFFDNEITNLLTVQLNGCRFAPEAEGDKWVDCLSYDEVRKRLLDGEQYISLYYPNFFVDLDSQDAPVKQTLVNELYQVQPDIYTKTRNFISNVNFLDDKGWMLEDIVEYNSISSLKTQKEIFLKNPEDFKGANSVLYTYHIYAAADEFQYKRSYKKIQELAALTGGFVKAVTVVCTLVLKPFVRFMRDKTLVENVDRGKSTVFRLEDKTSVSGKSTVSGIQRPVPVKERTKKVKIGIFAYFKCRIFSSVKNEDFVSFRDRLNKVKNKLDFLHYLQLCEKIEQLPSEQVKVNNFLDK